MAVGGTYVTHEPLKHHQLGLETLNLLAHLLLDGFCLLRCLWGMEMGEVLGGLVSLLEGRGWTPGSRAPDT